MMRTDQSFRSSVTRQHKSSQCRQFGRIKYGTAMAQGLPLTTVGGGAKAPASNLGSAGGCLTGEMQVGETWMDKTPHHAAAREGAGCPAPLANRMQKSRV